MLAITVRQQGVDVERPLKLADIICWRSLEGKPCLTPDQTANAISLSRRVIFVPILPATRLSSKGSKAVCENTTASFGSKEVLWEALIEHCKQLATALSNIGIDSTVDDSNKSTPGAKFNYWEEAGAVLRVEIGNQELITQTACLAIHPVWRSTACNVLAAQQDVIPVQATDSQQHKEPYSPSVLRVKGLTTPQLLTICQALIKTIQQAQPWTSIPPACQNVEDRKNTCATICSSTGYDMCHHLRSCSATPLPPSKPHALCRKLHLWPGCNQLQDVWYGPGGLLSVLQGRQTTSKEHHTEKLNDSQQHATCCPAVVCASHVRHLVGAAMPCHCQLGHVSQEELLREVQNRYLERQGTVTGWKRLETASAQLLTATEQQPTGSKAVAHSNNPHTNACEVECNDQADDSSGHEMTPTVHVHAEDGAGLNGSSVQQPASHHHKARARYEFSSRLSGPTLFVSGIPKWVTLRQAKDALHMATSSAIGGQPFKVRISRAVPNVTRGWAKLYVADIPAADMVLDKLNGLNLAVNRNDNDEDNSQPTYVSTPVSQAGNANLATAEAKQQDRFQVWVSPSCGRLDALYPHIHDARIRSRLRVDSVAAYSATDSATALTQAQLIASIAHVVRSGGNTTRPSDRTMQAAQPCVTMVPGLAVDATACAGGNTVALAQCFESVTAVELDEERAADLLHNLQLQGCLPPPVPVNATPSFCDDAKSEDSCDISDVQHTTAREGSLYSSSPSEPSTSARVHVVCGDYTHLWCHIPAAAAVLIDPPWGGPGYQEDTEQQANDNTHSNHALAQGVESVSQLSVDEAHNSGVPSSRQDPLAVCTCGTCLTLLASHARCPQGPGLSIGHTSICALTGALLGSGKAQVVSLKLPACTIPSHRRLADCVADHAAVVFNDSARHPSGLNMESNTNYAAVGCIPANIQIWAARAQFGRTSILLFARIGSCGTLVDELKKALKSWSAREHVLCNILGVFSEASY